MEGGGGEQSLIICSPPHSGFRGEGEDGGTGKRGIRGGDKNGFILRRKVEKGEQKGLGWKRRLGWK